MSRPFPSPHTLTLLLLLPLLLLLHAAFAELAPPPPPSLATSGRWIVDAATGERVKLACVNWPSHLETMLAEGLSKRHLDDISRAIRSMGFNCVRLTWPTALLAGRNASANLTVRRSFRTLGLSSSMADLDRLNPALSDLTLLEAFQAVVSNLGDNGLMVILDNHISKPGWCCSSSDGNAFFGDVHFDPNVWAQALGRMAALFKGHKNVIGMSLRNELRGPNQNVDDWFRYMQMGAEAVNAANAGVLVILSGLSFDNDLGFLSARRVNLTFAGRLVFELHWYAFSDGSAWADGNANDVCGRVAGSVMARAGFLLDQQPTAGPLFLSEFGADQRGGNVNDDRYLGCVLAFAAEKDLDWALWALQGSYYLREGAVDPEEVYGVLTSDWSSVRNRTVLRRIQSIQRPFRGPGVSAVVPPYTLIFHPSTGLCVATSSGELVLGACSTPWRYSGEEKTLSPLFGSSCLTAQGEGKRAALGSCGGSSSSRWELASASRMHLSTQPGGAVSLCLDVGEDGRSVVTNGCECLSGDATCDPERQWFKLVVSGRAIT